MRETEAEWMTRDEVAAATRFSPKTLSNWASMHPQKGPRCVRVGRMVRYRRDEVTAWQNSQLSADLAA
ncbi:helix-turn-helix transcriptional regulator [Nocardia sp. NPDC058640]|uniref:helix-turn-helix transcriptional regulator n=1 Tax=Nocardia sp. NPDC058640 TaxID=3346571 RepID=UPI0036480AEC